MGNAIATVLMTRPSASNAGLAAQLRDEWGDRVDLIGAPMIEIVPTGQVPDLRGIKGVIFTSSNGVLHAGETRDLPAYCVGTRTTSEARRAGWPAQQAGANSDELVEFIANLSPPGPLLHIGGVHKRGQVAERITAAGVPVRAIDVYDQSLLPLPEAALTRLNGDEPVIVPLFSPRSARQFASQFQGDAPLHLVAISEAILNEIANLPATTRRMAKSPDAEAMVETIRRVLRRVEAGETPV